ncbi:MAG: 3-hexulose-6-phosphate synthase [Candidatus Thermoplasmatota archaeon]
MDIILQVALDLLNGHRAMKIAEESIQGGADWIEAGTPLIKSEGMEIVRKLKDRFSDPILVADLKTMDTGALETEMASKAGADIVCILGVSDNSTIKEAVRSARKYGTKIMVDLIGVKNKVKRSKQMEKLGVHYLCLHVGIDEQMTGKKPVDILPKIISESNIPVAVAGGLNSETIPDMVKKGASIIVVGGAITKAENVVSATEKITRSIKSEKPVKTDLFKKYDKPEIKKALSKVSTANVSDALHRKGAIQGLKPVKKGFHIEGKVLTVKTIDGDWAKPVEAIDKAEEGEVIFIDVNKGKTAVWGELATWSAKKKKIEGVIINGAIRDLDEILKTDFPVFYRSIAPNAGEPKGFGEIGCEIICSGQKICSGDWIIGDDSGIVVIPQGEAQEIANRALNVKEQENRIREEIKKHDSSLSKVLKLKKWEKKTE